MRFIKEFLDGFITTMMVILMFIIGIWGFVFPFAIVYWTDSALALLSWLVTVPTAFGLIQALDSLAR